MSKPESRLRHAVPRAVADELTSAAFASLPRSDQRKKAGQYVHGLLEAEGRKSIRRIAALTGERAAEQSLQHFVSCSTWAWDEVRAALARHMEQTVRPAAWVVRPLVIPKAGSRSVGVARRLVPSLGQVINCQQAYGVWLAADDVSTPVHWRLHLPASWTEDEDRRREADIPDDAVAESPLYSAASAAVEMAEGGWGLGRRPVVLDCGGESGEEGWGFPGGVPGGGAPAGGSGAAGGPGPGQGRGPAGGGLPGTWCDTGDDSLGAAVLAAAGLPFVARIGGTAAVRPADAALSGHGRGPVTAQQVMAAARGLRRPVEWVDPDSGRLRTSLVARVPVIVAPPPGARTPFRLPVPSPAYPALSSSASSSGSPSSAAFCPAPAWHRPAGPGRGARGRGGEPSAAAMAARGGAARGTAAGGPGMPGAGAGPGGRGVRRFPAGPLRLSLLGEWEHPYRWPVRFWLTDLHDAHPAVLLRLAKLPARVDRDLAEVSDAVGIRDFEGRTYPGWHRHTTLASVAHGAAVVAALCRARDTRHRGPGVPA